jgi:hypothetical protein
MCGPHEYDDNINRDYNLAKLREQMQQQLAELKHLMKTKRLFPKYVYKYCHCTIYNWHVYSKYCHKCKNCAIIIQTEYEERPWNIIVNGITAPSRAKKPRIIDVSNKPMANVGG